MAVQGSFTDWAVLPANADWSFLFGLERFIQDNTPNAQVYYEVQDSRGEITGDSLTGIKGVLERRRSKLRRVRVYAIDDSEGVTLDGVLRYGRAAATSRMSVSGAKEVSVTGIAHTLRRRIREGSLAIVDGSSASSRAQSRLRRILQNGWFIAIVGGVIATILGGIVLLLIS